MVGGCVVALSLHFVGLFVLCAVGALTASRKEQKITACSNNSKQFEQNITQLYGLVMPAKKPHHTYVTAAANDEVRE